MDIIKWSFIQEEGRGWGIGVGLGIVILASYKFHFIKVHDNLLEIINPSCTSYNGV